MKKKKTLRVSKLK